MRCGHRGDSGVNINKGMTRTRLQSGGTITRNGVICSDSPMFKPPAAHAARTHAFFSAESDNKKAAARTAGRYHPRFIVRNVAPRVQTEPRQRKIVTANLPPGTEQIVHIRHGARLLGVDTACVQSRRVSAPLSHLFLGDQNGEARIRSRRSAH